MVAMTTFGKSGKGPDLYRFFDITPEAVAAKVKEALGR
jgi:transketolase